MQPGSTTISPKRERQTLVAILVLALIHGLVYVFLVPPWQHYDEPNHFEYVWLVAFRPGLPQPGDFDQSMQREVAQSMLDHGFFNELEYRPDLNPPADKPIWIGQYQQLGQPPLYYLVTSIPVRLLGLDDVTSQLYIARCVSLFFLLITVWISWGLTVEITPSGHPLRILVPLSLAMIPGFVDAMTALNSDAAAITVFSFFLWGCVRLIQRGFSIVDFIWTLIATVLAYLTKNTAYIALILFPVVIILAVLIKTKWRRWVWGVAALLGVLGIIVIFRWGEADLWYRLTNQNLPLRVESQKAPHGDHALCIEINPGDSQRFTQTNQLLPVEFVNEIRGESYTLGAWIWASSPTIIRLPIIRDLNGIQSTSNQIEVGTDPEFYVVRGTIPSNSQRVWVGLVPLVKDKTSPTVICYDSVVLTLGERPAGFPPEINDLSAKGGQWGTEGFQNLVRNGSFEESGIGIRPWAEELGTKFLPDKGRPSLILYSLMDLSSSEWYYRSTFYRLGRTFWGKFGWGHVPLLGHKPYRILGIFTGIGLVGAVIALWRNRRTFPWDVLILFGIVLFVVWGMTWVRGSLYIFYNPFFPVARYAYPVIIPTMFLLNLGWFQVLEFIRRWFTLPRLSEIVIYAGLMIILDVIAIASVISYYS
jgi:hypothetical protein